MRRVEWGEEEGKKTDTHFSSIQVIQVNLTSADLRLVEPNEEIQFTYSVNWYPTDVEFEDRFDNYLDDNFFEHQVNFPFPFW